jgi:hypothetical protein
VVTRRIIAALAVGFTLSGLFDAPPASAGSSTAVFRPTLVLGTAVPVPNGVKVGAAGAEWALPGGARLTAERDAELRVIAVPQQLDLGGKRPVPSYTVMLKSGIVRAHVPTNGQTAVVVSAPRKTSVLIAGGEASVVAGPQVFIANAEGTASVSVDGSPFHAVEPGTVEVPGTSKRQLIASPSLAGVPSVLLAFGKTAELDALDWKPVPDAHGYRVELREDSTKRVVAATETQAPSLPRGFTTLAVGTYSLRVTALDAVGIESAHPMVRPLRVLEVQLPPGAFVDAAGVVRFPPGSNIAFGRTDGVEMAFGHLGPFTPASPSLGLFRNQAYLLRLRANGADAARELWLMPRTTHASVQFGPRAPSWPGAPLEIDVRVEDASGEWVDLEPSVTVGVEPVAVTFTREGSRWHGVLPPRAGKGPWVVRVEVKDRSGMTLGRDFVEVAAGDAKPAGGGS